MTFTSQTELQTSLSEKGVSYQFRKATTQDIEWIKKCKKETIFAYADHLSAEEEQTILDYIDQHIPMEFVDIQIIQVDSNTVGCLCVKPFRNGFLLDEIYLEEAYRNQKIGSSIIRSLQIGYQEPLYLWVYQKNEAAIRLYRRLQFEVLEETEERFLMMFINTERKGE